MRVLLVKQHYSCNLLLLLVTFQRTHAAFFGNNDALHYEKVSLHAGEETVYRIDYEE